MAADDSGRHGAGGRTAGATPERPRVLLWFDYACPLCFVDRMRFDELERTMEVEVVDVPFELREGMREEGMSSAELGIEHSEHYEEHIHRQAAEHGIEMVLPDHIPNTHRALIMGEVARDGGPVLHRRVSDAIFRAYFVDGADIGDPAVLRSLAREAGLDPEAVEAAWNGELYHQRVRSFRHLGLSMGVSATPAALICNELLIGSRPLKVLQEAVSRCLSERSEDDGEASAGTPGAAMGD